MAVTIKTQDQIRDQLLAALAAGGLTATGSGTVNRTVTEALASALADSHFLLGTLLDGFFIDKAVGTFLDERVRDRLPDGRKPGTKATGKITFGRSSPAVATINIPAGTTLVTTDGTVELATTAAGTVLVNDTQCTVAVQASVVSAAANLPTGTVLRVKGIGVSGIETITVTNPGLTGGVDRETDAQLRDRYKLEVRNPRRSGSVSDYQAWALSVNGVTGVTVLPLNRGAGTVDILIITTGGIPSNQLVTDTQAYVNSVKPAVDDALVVKPTAVTVAVTLTATPAVGYTVAGLTAAVTAAVQGYINGLSVGDDVLLAVMISRVMAVAGVTNCHITAPAGDVVIGVTEKGIAGTVGVS